MSVEDLLAACRAKGLTIAVAESCTGGLLAGALTTPAGASDVFLAGIVSYSDDAKMEYLGVSGQTLSAFGAVSEEVAAEMAEGALQRAGADIAVSITGIAGPGPSDHKPEGRVCFALAARRGAARAETCEFGAIGRDAVRQASVDHALDLLKTAC